MLVLSRKKGEQVIIASGIRVTVLDVRGNCVRLGFIAPHDVPIHRDEVFQRVQSEKRQHAVLPIADSQQTDLPVSA